MTEDEVETVDERTLYEQSFVSGIHSSTPGKSLTLLTAYGSARILGKFQVPASSSGRPTAAGTRSLASNEWGLKRRLSRCRIQLGKVANPLVARPRDTFCPLPCSCAGMPVENILSLDPDFSF